MTRPAKRILVVDDEPYMHWLMRYHLGRAGYVTLGAKNGAEGLEVATRELPDLVIMDLMMAEVDGLTALKQLKQAERTRAIPVIILTASAHGAIPPSPETGVAAYFTKPFSPTELLAEIKRLLPESAAS